MGTGYDISNATFNGKPFPAPAEPSGVRLPGGYSVSFSCVIQDDAFDRIAKMFGAVRAEPTKPIATAWLPFGILGTLPVVGAVDLQPDGSLALDVDQAAWRRTLDKAVQSAICNPYQRDRIAIRALMHDNPRVREMARALAGDATIYRRPGGLYRHGDRKWQKAMRRLLRAAGIIGGAR